MARNVKRQRVRSELPLRPEPEGARQFKLTVDRDLARGMARHREVVWAKVCRDAIRRAIDELEGVP